MTFSIIIATLNRSTLLTECLEHLARQRFAPGDEVIVVDNGSTDDTQQVVARAAAMLPVPVIYLTEAVPGKTHALARGVREARGDILAFTDDDVDVEPNWLAAFREVMSDPTIALMGGPVVARWEKRPPRWLRGVAEGLGRLAAPIALMNYGSEVMPLHERTAMGGNMAVRREAFTRVGGFATHLGKLEGTLLSGEDRDLSQRIQAAGYRAIYHPAPRVSHWVPASRMRIGYYLAWFYWSGITHATLDGGGAGPRQVLGVPLFVVRRVVAGILGAAAAAATGHFGAAITHLSDVAFAAGYAAHRWRSTAAAPAFRESRLL